MFFGLKLCAVESIHVAAMALCLSSVTVTHQKTCSVPYPFFKSWRSVAS